MKIVIHKLHTFWVKEEIHTSQLKKDAWIKTIYSTNGPFSERRNSHSLRGACACFLPSPGLPLSPWGTGCSVWNSSCCLCPQGADSPGREVQGSTLSAALLHDWGCGISIATAFPQLNPHLLLCLMLYHMYSRDAANSDNHVRSCLNLSHIF